MKNKYTVFLALTIALLSNKIAFAKDEPLEFSSEDRNGFFLSLAPTIGYETQDFNALGFGGIIQLGVGVKEQFLIYAKLFGFNLTDEYDYEYNFSSFLVKGQYFFNVEQNNSPFINAGIGRTSVKLADYDYDPLSGVTAEIGAGYELRIGKKFYMSPELFINYNSIESQESITPSFAYHFGWYF